jgi:hypothetical protein
VPGQLSPYRYPRTVSLRYRSEIFGRALRSPCVAETGTKRVYDEYMTYTDYCSDLVKQFKH